MNDELGRIYKKTLVAQWITLSVLAGGSEKTKKIISQDSLSRRQDSNPAHLIPKPRLLQLEQNVPGRKLKLII
jgi:hypothetical protein